MQPRMDLVVRTTLYSYGDVLTVFLASSQGNMGNQKPASAPSHDQPLLIPHSLPQPSYTAQPLSTPSPMVYNYLNPVSGDRIMSLLPPDHPEMICLQTGSHMPYTHYGLLGERQSSHYLCYWTWFFSVRHFGSGVLVSPRHRALPAGSQGKVYPMRPYYRRWHLQLNIWILNFHDFLLRLCFFLWVCRCPSLLVMFHGLVCHSVSLLYYIPFGRQK